MIKKFERIAGSEDAMLLRDLISKIGSGDMSEALGAKVDTLIGMLREVLAQPAPQPQQVIQAPTEPAIDIPELIAKVYESTNVKPTYQFKIERNSSGVLTGITATPEVV